jgi:hypothetical protein
MATSAAVKLEVRWREVGTEAWSNIAEAPVMNELYIEGLTRGKQYEVEWRGVSACGAKSAWGSTLHTPPGVAVPLAISTLTAASLADGVHLTWATDGIQPAGIEYSIERSASSTTGFVERARVRATAFTDPETSGTTYYYRVRGVNFSEVYGPYSSVVSSNGVNVGAIGNTANQANANVPTVINPQFKNGTTGWTFDNAAGFYQEQGANSPDSACNTYLVRQGQAGGATTAARNLGYVSVVPGQTVTALCCLKSLSANAGAYAGVRISWRDLNHSELSVTHASVTCGPGGTYLQCVSKAAGQAPANAQFAHLEIEYLLHTSGYLNATSCNLTVQPASLGEVPDGGGRYGVHQVDGNGLAIVDFSQAGHVNKNLDYINDGGSFAKIRKGQLSNGILSLLQNGRNCIFNPTFTQNAAGIGNGAFVTSGTVIDGWTVSGGSAVAGCIAYFGQLYSRVLAGYVVAAGSAGSPVASYGGIASSTPFAVIPNSIYAFSVGKFSGASMPIGSLPAGVSVYHRVYISFKDSTGAVIRNDIFDDGLYNTRALVTAAGTVPSNATQAVIFLYIYFLNTGSAWTLPAGSYFDADISSIEYVQASDLSYQVTGTLSTQRNLPLVTWGNYGGGWSGLSIPYTTTTTSCTFNASAGTYIGGGDSIAYNASSVTVSGSAGAVITYYLFYDDPGMTGGSKTLQATTNQITSLNANGRVLVATVKVTFPTSGTGGGTGGGSCPQVDQPVICIRQGDSDPETIRAGDVRVGDRLLLSSGRWGLVSFSERRQQPGVRVVGADGSSITCSASAPLETAEGPCVVAPYTRGLVLRHRTHGVMRVAEVFDVGDIWVQHITCENDCFWVGDYSHHNRKPDPIT